MLYLIIIFRAIINVAFRVNSPYILWLAVALYRYICKRMNIENNAHACTSERNIRRFFFTFAYTLITFFTPFRRLMPNASLPLISVVLAAYNGARFIEQQVHSILEQDHRQLELIIVDDASSDDTTKRLEQMASQDARIKLHLNEQNVGYIRTFEKGLALAQGDYIALSDQDDVWAPHKLSTLLAQITHYPIIFSDSQLIDDKNQHLPKKLSDIKQLSDVPSCLCYAIGGSAPGHAMLIRKDIIQHCFPFPTILPHDYWLAFVATWYGTIKYIPATLNFYRQHAHNVFGAGQRKKKPSKPNRQQLLQHRHERLTLLAGSCPDHLPEKNILQALAKTYQSYSLEHNLKRMRLFFQYQESILLFKKRSAFRKWLFCLKTFFVAP